jgi:hypothetical protein
MPMYEKAADREQQGLALFSLQRHLERLSCGPVRMNETEEHLKLPYDAELWVHGKYVGVVEVKTTNYPKHRVEEWGHLQLKKGQLTRLREMFYRKKAISGAGYWAKQVVIMYRSTVDDSAWAINIEDVMRLWPESEITPAEFCKDDHGNKLADDECRYIKLQHWEVIV